MVYISKYKFVKLRKKKEIKTNHFPKKLIING